MATSHIIQAFHHLRKANLHLILMGAESKGGLGKKLATLYIKKIDWIKTDFFSIPQFTEEVRAGIRKEWNDDILVVDNINDMITLLPPEKRELVETIIIALLNGEEIKIEENGTN